MRLRCKNQSRRALARSLRCALRKVVEAVVKIPHEGKHKNGEGQDQEGPPLPQRHKTPRPKCPKRSQGRESKKSKITSTEGENNATAKNRPRVWRPA